MSIDDAGEDDRVLRVNAPMQRRAVVVWGTVLAISLTGLFLTAVMWLIGVGRYLEGYCGVQQDLGTVSIPPGASLTTTRLTGPATVGCDWSQGTSSGTVRVADIEPLIWTLVLAGLALGGILVLVLVARLLARQRLGDGADLPERPAPARC